MPGRYLKLTVLLIVAAIFVTPAQGSKNASGLTVTLVAQTATTITLGWNPQAGAIGVVFFVDGVWVSHTKNPKQVTVKFAKQNATFGVESLPGRDGTGFAYGEFVWPPSQPPPPPPPSIAANIWVDGLAGGTCTFQPSQVNYNQATACRDLPAAYTSVPDGVTASVFVRNGVYPAQVFAGARDRTGGQIIFSPENNKGATVAGNITLGAADFVTIQGFTVANGLISATGVAGSSAPLSDQIIGNRINVGASHNGFSISLGNVQNMLIARNTIGTTVAHDTACSPHCPSVEGLRIGKGTTAAATCGPIATQACDVTISDNLFQYISRNCGFWPNSGFGSCPGVTCANADGCHMDGIHIWGLDGGTITRNVLNGIECQGIFLENTNNSLNRNIAITNNLVSYLVGGCSSKGIYLSAGGSTNGLNGFAGHWLLAFNSGTGSMIVANGCGSCQAGTSFDIIGNHMPLFNSSATGNNTSCTAAFGNATVNYSYNLWRSGGSNHVCSPTDSLANDTFANAVNPPISGVDMHLSGFGGSAHDFVPAIVCKSVVNVDVDNDARPVGTACEAGADENG